MRHWKRNRLWLLVWAEVRIKDRLKWKLDRSDVSNIKIVSECRRHYLIIFIWFLSGKKRNSIFQRVISIKIFLSFLVLLVSHDQHKIIAKIQDLVPIFFSSYLLLFFSLLFSCNCGIKRFKSGYCVWPRWNLCFTVFSFFFKNIVSSVR